MNLYFFLVFLGSIFLLFFANFLSGNDFNEEYRYLPDKYFLKNTKLLKLYIRNPKEPITKSGFIFYVSQFLLVISSVVLLILTLFNVINLNVEQLKIIIEVMLKYFICCYVSCRIFNSIVDTCYGKHKKSLKILIISLQVIFISIFLILVAFVSLSHINFYLLF